MMGYLFPGTVDVSRAEDWAVKEFHGMRPSGLNGINFEGVEIQMAVCMEDITPPSGSLSDPRMASTERGQRIVEESVARLVRFVTWFKTTDPKINGEQI